MRLVTAETLKRDILLSLYTGRAKNVFFIFYFKFWERKGGRRKTKEERKNTDEWKCDVRRSKEKAKKIEANKKKKCGRKEKAKE